MKTQDYRAEKSYFRNNSKFGRTTKLINKISGKVVFEAMGICTITDLINSYNLSK
jgi:hypothetical protein